MEHQCSSLYSVSIAEQAGSSLILSENQKDRLFLVNDHIVCKKK